MSGSAENYVVNGQTVSIGSDVSGAGVTGSSNTILVGTDSSVGIVGSNNVVAISNGDAVGLEAGSGNFIVGSNGVVVSAISVSATTMFGNNNIIYTGLNNSINIYGNSNDINNSDGDYTGVLSGINDIISGSDGVIETDAGVLDTYIVGSNNFFAAGSGNTAQILGSNNAIYLSNGDVLVLDSGSANNITSNDGNIVTSADIYGTTLTGSFNTALFATANSSVLFGDDNTLTVGNDDSITLNGNANTLSVGSDDQVTVAGTSQYISGIDSNSIVLNGSNGTLNFDSGNQIEITGSLNVTTLNSNNTLTIDGFNNIVRSTGSDNTIVLSGDYNVVRPGYTASIDILSGNNDTINAISSMLSLSNDVENVLLVGTFDTVLAGANDGINLGGLGTDVTIGSLGYVGIVGGANDTVNMTGGILNTLNDIENINLIGSNNQVGGGSSISIDVSGNQNAINAGNGSSITLGSGTNDNVYISNGILQIDRGVTNAFLMGSNDAVTAGTIYSGGSGIFSGIQASIYYLTNPYDINININGTNDVANMIGDGDFVGLTGGSDDTVNMSNGQLDAVDGVTNIMLNGSSNGIAVGSGVADSDISVTIDGSSNLANFAGTGDIVEISAGSYDTLNMSNGQLNFSNGVSNIIVNGSDDTIIGGIGISLDVSGDTNQVQVGNQSSVTLGSGSYNNIALGSNGIVNLASGTNADVQMSSGTLSVASNDIGVELFGSSNLITGGSSIGISSYGNSDVFNLGTGSNLFLMGGNADTVNMSNGSLTSTGTVTNIVLNGSGDIVNLGYDNQITVNGNNNTLNLYSGDNVTLSAGDSGDIINLFGGTVSLGASLSNIIVNGTGDNLMGPGSSMAAGITVTSTYELINNGETFVIPSDGILALFTTLFPGVIEVTSTFAPSVVYNSGDIQDLVNYFEANPNLSSDEIMAAESDPNYQTNLQNFLKSADVYGGSDPLPSNVLAMLDGYSSIYLAILGVSPTAFSKAEYIEQQLEWAVSNYPIPTDELSSVLQNLMPVLLSTNTKTESVVQSAIGLLESGRAGASGGNQTPMLNDTAAIMELDSAENPGQGSFGEEVYTPGRSGHWQIIYTASSGSLTFQYKSPPLIDQVLNFVDAYLTPIVDAAAFISGNPEIALAADALTAVQAGQAFASGADLQGVFDTLEVIGGGLQQLGVGEAANLGKELSTAVGIAQGIDGVVTGVEEGNALEAITSALSTGSGIAGLSGQSSIQQFAAVGASLGAAAQELGSGNIIAGLTSLVEAAQTAGILHPLEQDLESLFEGFYTSTVSTSISAGGPPIPVSKSTSALILGTLGGPLLPGQQGYIITTSNGGIVISLFDQSQPGNTQIQDDVLSLDPGPGTIIVTGHGEPSGIMQMDGTQLVNDQQIAASIEGTTVWQNDLRQNITPQIELLSCYTGGDPSDPTNPYALQGADPGSLANVNVAQFLANDLSNVNPNVVVTAPTAFLWAYAPGSDAPSGAIQTPNGGALYVAPNINPSVLPEYGPATTDNGPNTSLPGYLKGYTGTPGLLQ